MAKIELGQVTAPVGIKGEIRVYPYLEQARFSDINKVIIGSGTPVRIEKLRFDKGLVVMKVSGTDDRNAAELLRGKKLYLPEDETLDLGKDTYLVGDLIGLKVVDVDGNAVGELTDVVSRSVQDLYEIKTAEGKTFLLPAVKEFVLHVDINGGTMTVSIPEGLMDL